MGEARNEFDRDRNQLQLERGGDEQFPVFPSAAPAVKQRRVGATESAASLTRYLTSFGGGQNFPVARKNIFKRKVSDFNPDQPQRGVLDGGRHAPYLTIFPFD